MGYWNNILFLFLSMSMAILHFSQAQNSQQDFLDAHNQARAQVGVGPLMWDDRVAGFARNYADQRRGDCQLLHSQNRPYGENIAGGGEPGYDLTVVGAVNLWVGEKGDYDHSSNTCAAGQECRHYTQVVWRNSVRLGCARVQCNNGAWFVTCNYDPPGNYRGQSPY